jgi:hypothetical protein
LVLAADTSNVSDQGHRTSYPGDEATVAIVVPTRDGKAPPHRVLYDGPCEKSEIL